MDDELLDIKIETQDTASHSRQKRRGPNLLVVGAVITVGLVVLVALVLSLRKGDEADTAANQTETQDPAPVESQLPKPTKEPATPHRVAEDDGQMLWVSPTAGKPLDLAYVPLGTQLLLHVRPAQLVSYAEGEKILASLGPWGAEAIAQLEKITGAQLREISTLLVGLHPEENGNLGCSLRLQFLEPWTEEMFSQRLPESSSRIIAGQACQVVGDQICYLPKDEAGRILVVCSIQSAPDLIANGASAPPLVRDMQRLVDVTDDQRLATLLFPTKFFRASGNDLLQGTAKQLEMALRQVVGDDTTTVALCAHWDENFFFELQSTVSFNTRPHRFLEAVANRLSESSEALEKSLTDVSLHPYGKQVLSRLPAMLRQFSNFTRVGNERGVSVVRCYLPLPAGHNLLAATELMLNCREDLGQPGQIAADLTPAQGRPQSVAEALQRPTTLAFPKETLQKALEILSEDLGVSIQLRGRDLQLEGITKNQSFSIDLREQKAAEILLAILQLANPDRTATGPADPKQKLVYVIREAADGKPGAIVVTTRIAAKKQDLQLPDVFRPNR